MKMGIVLLLGVVFTVSQAKASGNVKVTEESPKEVVTPEAEVAAESPVEKAIGTGEKTVEVADDAVVGDIEKTTKYEKKEKEKEQIKEKKVQKEEKTQPVVEKSLEQIRHEKETLQRQTDREVFARRAEEFRSRFRVDASTELTALRRVVRQEYEISQDMERAAGSRFVTDRRRNRMVAKMEEDMRRLRREREVMITSILGKVGKYYDEIVKARYETISILPQRERALATTKLRDEMRIVTNAIFDEIAGRINIVPMENQRVVMRDIESRLTQLFDVKISEMGQKKLEAKEQPPAPQQVEEVKEEKVVNPEEELARRLLEEHKKREKMKDAEHKGVGEVPGEEKQIPADM